MSSYQEQHNGIYKHLLTHMIFILIVISIALFFQRLSSHVCSRLRLTIAKKQCESFSLYQKLSYYREDD